MTNPLRTRADLQAAAAELWRPLRRHFERDGAAASLGDQVAVYGRQVAGAETFVRPLWAVAAWAAGGGDFPDGELLRRTLLEGVDPAHPRYWGELGQHDQRAVEMASLAAALWLAPGLLWTPLSGAGRRNVAAWLQQINGREVWDNNWRFFRVLVNGALAALGERSDEGRVRADLERLAGFHHGDGWYTDGETPQFDYYIPMAMHFYGLFYAKMAAPGSRRADDFRAWARAFAPHFASWFAPDGSALPMGRSLTYRCAQGAFWGGLAFADEEALPWGVIKRLHLQHLRWWFRQPIFVEDGLLSSGYRYPNHIMMEAYNAPGSPYWAMKALLPLALSAAHPFWQAEESAPVVAPIVTPRGCPGLVVCRDEAHGHVFALTSNPVHPAGHRHGVQKYGKFVYSTAFGFDVPVGGNAPRCGTADSMLLVSVDGRDWRAREEFVEMAPVRSGLHTRWQPWPDVTIDTWLAPALPGHVRVHRIRTARPLTTVEGGFPIEKSRGLKTAAGAGRVCAENGTAVSGIWDITGGRNGEVIVTEPNTNLLHPLTVVPGVRGEVSVGETWLFTAVAGWAGEAQSSPATRWREELAVELGATGPRVLRDGQVILELSGDAGVAVRTVHSRRQPAPSLLRRLKSKVVRALK